MKSHGDGPSISREELYRLVWSRPMQAAASELGMTTTGLGKICDRLLIPRPQRGYWAKVRKGMLQDPPALGPPPRGADTQVWIRSNKTRSRRAQTRLSPIERKAQILQYAAKLIAEAGPSACTLTRIARELGLSEAQVYRYFGTQQRLFVELAKAEIAEISLAQQNEMQRGSDHFHNLTLAAVAYLRQISSRGPVLHVLLDMPDVRHGLRAQNVSSRHWNLHRVGARLTKNFGVPPTLSLASTSIFVAAARRAGKLVSRGKVSLASAEEILSLMVLASGRRIVRRHGKASS